LAAALLCPSCSKAPQRKPVYPAQGKVLYKGKPISPATVFFHPLDGSPERPIGKTRQDGSYRLSTYSDKDGAPAGEYAVTVEWSPPIKTADGDLEAGVNQLPAKYGKKDTSGLRAKITEGSNDVPTFELSD
jgi:hypothetical protein